MPKIGELAPNFALTNQDGKRVQLSDYRGQRVVLFAFTKAGTPGCTAQACAFRDEFDDLRAVNAAVLTISADSQAQLAQFKQERNLPYDLLSDPDRAMLTAWGAYGASALGLFKLPMTLHSLWVIDENGVVIQEKIGVPPGAVKAALGVLRGLPAMQTSS
jgi:thioredoxin-dependent peroxiredoxin